VARRSRTRERLIDASVIALNQHGYISTTIDDIVAVAGTSRQTFYLYFRSKADVVREIMLRLEEPASHVYQALDELVDPSPEQLRQWLIAAVEYWHTYREAIAVTEQAIAVEPELSTPAFTTIAGTVGGMSKQLARSRGSARASADLRLILMILQLERFCYFWIIRGVDLDEDLVFDTLTSLWWSTLVGPDINSDWSS
jgi:AcrR family transcriptional regulator